jgi:hypothetical protein
VEKDGKSGHLLSCEGLPSESSYIDGMRDNWMVLKAVRRTAFAEPQEIVLPMKSRRTDEKISLVLPDFKGEVFQRILENTVSDNIREWCIKAEGILFMLNLGGSSPEFFQEEMSEAAKPRVEMEKVVMTSDDITDAIKNVLLLKFLWTVMGDCPISICFSCWDIRDVSEGISAEQWVKENHPCIYNFVEEHFTEYRYFGVSAQGADYQSLDYEHEENLAQKTTKKERAFVYTNKKSYDITEPIDYILSSNNED